MNNSTKNDLTVGLLVQRKNIPNPIVQDLYKELLLYLFEAQIMLKAIDSLRHKKFIVFDGSIGDAKCQTRTSMILDLFEDETNLFHILDQEEFQLTALIEKIQNIITQLHFDNHGFIKQNLHTFKYPSMLDFITKYQIFFTPSSQLLLTGLSYVITLSRNAIHNLIHPLISKNKIDKLQELAKMKLCQLSVEYEQNLALKYGSSQDYKVLTQIESKQYSSGLSSMTAFFPSFKVILEKMKKEKQPILIHNILFCKCGGVISQEYNLFELNNHFIPIDFKTFPTNQPLMIITGYQFQGSFAQLKTLLNVPLHSALINPEFQKSCACSQPPKLLMINKIEELILGTFAQHPQFINDAPIDFKSLGLENSELKKEFDYLQTIPGCSDKDMSIFDIKHIYPSTIAEFLEQQKETTAVEKTAVTKTPIRS